MSWMLNFPCRFCREKVTFWPLLCMVQRQLAVQAQRCAPRIHGQPAEPEVWNFVYQVASSSVMAPLHSPSVSPWRASGQPSQCNEESGAIRLFLSSLDGLPSNETDFHNRHYVIYRKESIIFTGITEILLTYLCPHFLCWVTNCHWTSEVKEHTPIPLLSLWSGPRYGLGRSCLHRLLTRLERGGRGGLCLRSRQRLKEGKACLWAPSAAGRTHVFQLVAFGWGRCQLMSAHVTWPLSSASHNLLASFLKLQGKSWQNVWKGQSYILLL